MEIRLFKPRVTGLASGIVLMAAAVGAVRSADKPAAGNKDGVVHATHKAAANSPSRIERVSAAVRHAVAQESGGARGKCRCSVCGRWCETANMMATDYTVDAGAGDGRVRHARVSHCRACRGRVGPVTNAVNFRPWHPVDPYYYDRRDTQAYSAVGYSVPMSVPLAPVVGYTYNYGWGVPSSRLTRIGSSYNRWYPQTWYTQAGAGPEAAGPNPPIILQPVDTMQQGYYYKHVPAWQPAPLGGWPNYPVIPRFTR